MRQHALSVLPQVRGVPACPDCPATHEGVLSELVRKKGKACDFRSGVLPARDVMPWRWFAFGFGLVRRGILLRQRVDSKGLATAVDAVGPGGMFPLDPEGQGSAWSLGVSGYAVTDVLVCLCPSDSVSARIDAHGATATEFVQLHRRAIDRIERLMDARGRANSVSRVAALLCALVDTLSPAASAASASQEQMLPSDIQQRDLAALASVRHESVCRALGRLSSLKLIRRDPDGIRILDRARLESI